MQNKQNELWEQRNSQFGNFESKLREQLGEKLRIQLYEQLRMRLHRQISGLQNHVRWVSISDEL